MRRWIAILAVVVASAVAVGFYYLRISGGKPVAARDRTARAELRTIVNSVNATGTVRLRVGSEVRVGSQLSGIVRKLFVTVGSHVRAEEVIAEIDDSTIRARLADAEAQIAFDAASMEHARVNHERAHRLTLQGLIPAQQGEDLRLAFEEAQAKYQKSLRDRDMVQVDLKYVQIRAPIRGVVASVSTQEGETVAASFTAPTFVTIIADNALQLVAMVDETDIAAVRAGNPVTFTVDSYAARDFPGTVARIAPKATILSGVVNYEVTINITKDAALLKPDMTTNVSIQTAQHESIVLPTAAVQRDGEQNFVLVPGSPVWKPVVTGAKEGEMIEIKHGLSAGDLVLLQASSDSKMPKSAVAEGSR